MLSDRIHTDGLVKDPYHHPSELSEATAPESEFLLWRLSDEHSQFDIRQTGVLINILPPGPMSRIRGRP